MSAPFDKPLSPAKATEHIRSKANSALRLSWTAHAKDRMKESGLIMGDVVHILKHGFVLEDGEPSTQPGCFKYIMECTTPNSGGRTVRIVVIPAVSNSVKIVTVMWKDER